MYNATGQCLDETKMLQQHGTLVKKIAYQMKAKLPASVEVDDLIQAGMMGLLDAVKKFQDNSIKLRSEISIIEFESMFSFLQIKTIELFFTEFFEFEKESNGEANENTESSKSNLNILFSLLINSISLSAIKALEKSNSSCKGLLDISNLLKAKIFSLEITKDLSKIEISRNKRIEGYFDNQIQDIQNFISGNKDNISNIQEITSAAANEIKNIIDHMNQIYHYINNINKKLKNQNNQD